MKSLKELFLSPESEGYFDPERLAQIEQALIQDNKSNMPWYLRVIVAIGAWLASCFFLACALIFVDWDENHRLELGIGGLVLLVVAVIVGRQKWGIFIGQCALAFSLAGQAMIYFGFLPNQYPIGMTMVFALVLATVLYVLYPDFLSRLITCFAALQVTRFWIYSGDQIDFFSGIRSGRPHSEWLMIMFWTLQLAGICWCFMHARRSILFAPLGYALILSLAAWHIEDLVKTWISLHAPRYYSETLRLIFLYYLRSILIAVTLFAVSVWAAGGMAVMREKARLLVIVAVALIALACFGTGGVLLALLFLLLGFSLQNGPIFGLGLLLFPVFLTYYYYNLNLDLLVKSGVLIGSGLVLLLLRTGIKHGILTSPKEAA